MIGALQQSICSGHQALTKGDSQIMKKQEKLLHWPEWSQEEKDLLILQSYLSDYVGEEEADAFVRKVCESAGREKGSWKE